MLTIKNITIRNFLSIGNVTQAINLERQDLTLVLGDNLDLGSAGSRNGAGKTSMINAISYALYGDALTKIRKDNLINTTNNKNMLVSIDFIRDNVEYRIERGRKPNVLRFFINNSEYENNAQGDSRDTQGLITSTLGISHNMFKHIVALNTYTPPFLDMSANDQRNTIEELLGITILTEKSNNLREEIKVTKSLIQQEDYKIEALLNSNKSIETQIKSLQRKSRLWEEARTRDINDCTTQIEQLEELDITNEVKNHELLGDFKKQDRELTQIQNEINALMRSNKKLAISVFNINTELKALRDNKCYACGQDLHDHDEQLKVKEQQLDDVNEELNTNEESIDTLQIHYDNIAEHKLSKPSTFYGTLKEALDHQYKLDGLTDKLTRVEDADNTYTEQIYDLENTALQKIDYEPMNEMTRLKDHQEFLLKLLTNKDSFVRKSIIEQNLSYLNIRLAHYTSQVGLNHQVKFLNDLTVEITSLGRDLDFHNLSRGEKNRVILSFSWAFRDVWESLYTPINIMFVDEVIDSGMDSVGVELGLTSLKSMARDRNKSVWLISHKEELSSRVNHVLTVIKEDGFTTFSSDMI
jgi:DNA repair exonuclease SbcCD ATPase subunit